MRFYTKVQLWDGKQNQAVQIWIFNKNTITHQYFPTINKMSVKKIMVIDVEGLSLTWISVG